MPSKLQEEIAQLNLVIVEAGLANIMKITPTLEDEIRKAQPDDPVLQKYVKHMLEGQTSDFFQGPSRYTAVLREDLCTKSSRFKEENTIRSTRILVFYTPRRY